MADDAKTVEPRLSAEDSFLRGLWDMMPLTIGAAPFGLIVGTLGAQAGLSHLDVLLMGGLVYAGASQFIALEMWTSPVPVLAIIGVTAMVNLRHVLMGAALSPHIRHLPPHCRWPLTLIFSDETWAMALRRAYRSPLKAPYVFGLIGPFYVNWLLWSALGVSFGSLITNPAAFGFDFVFTAVFITLIIGFCKDRYSLPPLVASVVTALAAQHFLPGVWYIFLGGVAGTVMGALLHREKARS